MSRRAAKVQPLLHAANAFRPFGLAQLDDRLRLFSRMSDWTFVMVCIRLHDLFAEEHGIVPTVHDVFDGCSHAEKLLSIDSTGRSAQGRRECARRFRAT